MKKRRIQRPQSKRCHKEQINPSHAPNQGTLRNNRLNATKGAFFSGGCLANHISFRAEQALVLDWKG